MWDLYYYYLLEHKLISVYERWFIDATKVSGVSYAEMMLVRRLVEGGEKRVINKRVVLKIVG